MSTKKEDAENKHTAVTAGGAAAGAVAGAAIGTVVPGVGNVVGAVVGGVIGLATGAAAGKLVADKVVPEAEDQYWKQNYDKRPYAKGASYDDLQPAYRYGWETRAQYPTSKRFDDVEPDLASKWDSSKGKSQMTWDKAKNASRDAWDRIERALPGDFDKDGK